MPTLELSRRIGCLPLSWRATGCTDRVRSCAELCAGGVVGMCFCALVGFYLDGLGRTDSSFVRSAVLMCRTTRAKGLITLRCPS